jgi:hypothetical protein
VYVVQHKQKLFLEEIAMKNPYSWSNARLVGALIDAAREPSSDAVIEHLRSVLYARLEGVRPPLAPNERLRIKYGISKSMSVNTVDGKHQYFEERRTVIVARVWYRGGERWGFDIVGGSGYIYAIEDFERLDADDVDAT